LPSHRHCACFTKTWSPTCIRQTVTTAKSHDRAGVQGANNVRHALVQCRRQCGRYALKAHDLFHGLGAGLRAAKALHDSVALPPRSEASYCLVITSHDPFFKDFLGLHRAKVISLRSVSELYEASNIRHGICHTRYNIIWFACRCFESDVHFLQPILKLLFFTFPLSRAFLHSCATFRMSLLLHDCGGCHRCET